MHASPDQREVVGQPQPGLLPDLAVERGEVVFARVDPPAGGEPNILAAERIQEAQHQGFIVVREDQRSYRSTVPDPVSHSLPHPERLPREVRPRMMFVCVCTALLAPP